MKKERGHLERASVGELMALSRIVSESYRDSCTQSSLKVRGRYQRLLERLRRELDEQRRP